MTSNTDLSPCPLCGGGAGVHHHGTNAISTSPAYGVQCSDCGCRTQWRKTIARAVKDWNRRVKSSD